MIVPKRSALARLVVLALLLNGLFVSAPPVAGALDIDGVCGRRYIAAGDHIPAGHEVSRSERFPSQLREDHLAAYGWCVMNIAVNETTSSTYITGSQLSQTRNLWPDLITLTVGEENSTIVNLVNSCFDKVKDHDFTGANTCAAQILGNSTLWSSLTSNLTTTLQAYRIIMAGRPQLVVALTVGEENSTIVNLVNSCFDKVKDHDFTGANTCAAQILGNSTLWSSLTSNLTTTLQAYRIIMAGRPQLVVALTGYPNPYPDALDVTPKIAELCTPLIDNILPCTVRWAQLPPALVTIDQVFTKLNTTIQNSLKPFQAGPSGNRYVFVDTYTKTRDHCMKMDVEMKTTVEHPELEGQVHHHDNFSAVSFGCDEPWYVEGSDGTKIPDYLAPSTPGILINKSQTTKGMGIHPDADGHECIADLIWEADTIDPGTTPLKWKLNVPEASSTDICQ